MYLRPSLSPSLLLPNAQPSHRAKVRDGFQDLEKQPPFATRSTWPVLSILTTRSFFSIVPHEPGAAMSQSPTVTLLVSGKPFRRRMGSLGSQHRDIEPMATVLTAGSTEQSTPHHCRLTHCGHKKVQAKIQTLYKMAGTIQDLSGTLMRSPVQFPQCLGELSDE